MPIYEYICTDCGNKFDILRPFRHADDPVDCLSCKGQNTKRILSIFFAHSEKGNITRTRSGCSECKSGSCGGCHH